MLRQYARFLGAGLRIVDLAALGAALSAVLVTWPAVFGDPRDVPLESMLEAALLALVAWPVAAWLSRVYDTYRTRSLGTELWRIARALLGVAVVVGVGELAFPSLHLLHGPTAAFLALSFAFLAAFRVASRLVLRSARSHGRNLRYYAVVGSGPFAEEVIAGMERHREWGFELAGLVLDDGSPAPRPERPVLGLVGDLPRLLEERVLDQVIFATPPARLVALQRAAAACQERGVSVMFCLDLLPGGIGRMALSDVDGVPALTYSTVPSDALALAAKRAFDVVASAAALLILSPVLAAVAIAIKWDSPGPVLFRQRRVGLNGREFDLYKFRSMRVDAEAQLAALRARNEMSGPVFKMTDDPRVTRVGRFIRKTSLDEFPQFWNVLLGHMSVVGPRPPIPSEVRQYQPWQRRRLSVRPGITCTWQVSGRNQVDFEQWMQLDLQYIDHWSLWGDLQIVLKTVPAVLTARGAH